MVIEPYFANDLVTLYKGDCRAVLRELTKDPKWRRVHAVVTDPPYHLGDHGFMNKSWDASGVSFDFVTWRQVAYAMLPGAYLLAFGGTRTAHRITCAIEDAGLDITDSIYWVQGQGFPKSFSVSKGIDAQAGAVRKVTRAGKTKAGELAGKFDQVASSERERRDEPVTAAAKKWEGWGSALKPSVEPCVLAQKPFDGTIAGNVLRHGAGALNIDASRVGTSKRVPGSPKVAGASAHTVSLPGYAGGSGHDANVGRWPANLIHDASPEVEACFPDAKGMSGGGTHKPGYAGGMFGNLGDSTATARKDDGSASRFFKACSFEEGEAEAFEALRVFYCAKASTSERERGRWLHDSKHVRDRKTEPWESEGQSQSILAATGTSPRVATTGDACGIPKREVLGWYSRTCSFGSENVARSLPAFKCITSTKSKTTTESKTSSALTRRHTSDCTRGASFVTESGGSRAPSVEGTSQSVASTGISAPRIGRYTGGVDLATSRKSSSKSESGQNVGGQPREEVRVGVRHNDHPT